MLFHYCSDVNAIDSLDIDLEHLSLVGGEKSFLSDCGGISPSACSFMSASVQTQRVLKINMALTSISEELKAMERCIVKDMVSHTAAKETLKATVGESCN